MDGSLCRRNYGIPSTDEFPSPRPTPPPPPSLAATPIRPAALPLFLRYPPCRATCRWLSSTFAASFCVPSFVYDRNDPVRVHFSRTPYRGKRRERETERKSRACSIQAAKRPSETIHIARRPVIRSSVIRDSCLARVFTSAHCSSARRRRDSVRAIVQDRGRSKTQKSTVSSDLSMIFIRTIFQP